jgi:GTP-binding protein
LWQSKSIDFHRDYTLHRLVKSTLVNAMVGVEPKRGPASVNARAGWTDQICFYQLGKHPPILNLVDFPGNSLQSLILTVFNIVYVEWHVGYGHAVASMTRRKEWKLMIKDFLNHRVVLCRCCVLIDCTRGLCSEDVIFIRFLIKQCEALKVSHRLEFSS